MAIQFEVTNEHLPGVEIVMEAKSDARKPTETFFLGWSLRSITSSKARIFSLSIKVYFSCWNCSSRVKFVILQITPTAGLLSGTWPVGTEDWVTTWVSTLTTGVDGNGIIFRWKSDKRAGMFVLRRSRLRPCDVCSGIFKYEKQMNLFK